MLKGSSQRNRMIVLQLVASFRSLRCHASGNHGKFFKGENLITDYPFQMMFGRLNSCFQQAVEGRDGGGLKCQVIERAAVASTSLLWFSVISTNKFGTIFTINVLAQASTGSEPI